MTVNIFAMKDALDWVTEQWRKEQLGFKSEWNQCYQIAVGQ